MREDTAAESPEELVGIGTAAETLGLSVKTLRRMADSGMVPSVRTQGGHRRFAVEGVRAALGIASRPSAPVAAVDIAPSAAADWRRALPLKGLDEAEVWAEARAALDLPAAEEGTRIMNYAFTEMLNNAIDHSGGSQATVEVWTQPDELAARISDDGRGAFARVREGLNLASDLEAAAELTKGKRTTWAQRHTGEGIFFTSKVVTLFRLSANGLRLTVDNARDDYALGSSHVHRGTVVEMRLTLPPARTLRSVFEDFTDEDLRFSRSRPRIELFGTGLTFVSRSEARRVLSGMSDFDDIDVDFAGVTDVGQGFVDELMRVWPAQNPGIRLHPINMNEAVAFMVRRAERTASR